MVLVFLRRKNYLMAHCITRPYQQHYPFKTSNLNNLRTNQTQKTSEKQVVDMGHDLQTLRNPNQQVLNALLLTMSPKSHESLNNVQTLTNQQNGGISDKSIRKIKRTDVDFCQPMYFPTVTTSNPFRKRSLVRTEVVTYH